MSTLDFLNSFFLVGDSNLRDSFALFDNTTELGQSIQNKMDLDYDNRIYFVKKEQQNDAISRLDQLFDKYNSSTKDNEEKIDFSKDVVPGPAKAFLRKKFGTVNIPVLLSLPKKYLPEVRLLCGVSSKKIMEEVKDDRAMVQRIENAKLYYQFKRMFPIVSERNEHYQDFSFVTKEGENGLHNVIIDKYDREIAEISNNKDEDTLRDTFSLSFRYPSSDKEQITKLIAEIFGESDSIEFSDITKYSEALNRFYTETKTRQEVQPSLPIKEEEDDSLVYDNTSNEFDSEAIVHSFDGPFELTEPHVFIPEDVIADFIYEQEKIEENGTDQNTGLENEGLFAGNGKADEPGQDNNGSSVQQPGRTASNQQKPTDSHHGNDAGGNTEHDPRGNQVDNSGNQERPVGVAVGGQGNKNGKPSGEGSGSGNGGFHNEADVRGDSGATTTTPSEPQPNVVLSGSGSVHPNAEQSAEGGNTVHSGTDDGVRADNPVREGVVEAEPVIYNEGAYIDSEHDVVIPKAGTLEAYNANIEAIKTLTAIIKRGDFDVTDEEKETLKKYTGFGGQTTKFITQHSNLLEWENRDSEVERIDKSFDLVIYNLCEALAEADKKSLLPLYGITDKTTIKSRAVKWQDVNETSKDIVNSLVAAGTYDYYTPKLVTGLQKTIFDSLGIKGGSYKEPSAGIGNMVHALDRETISKFNITSVEMNVITGLINKCLNPSSNVVIARLEDSQNVQSDVTITNNPFSENVSVSDKKFLNNPDKRYSKAMSTLTGYFPLKMIEETKPGGIVVCLNTSGFLDNYRHTSTRELISEKANLIGAIRLPEGIFPDTKVNTDLIIFQKFGKNVPRLQNHNTFAKTTDKVLDMVEYRLNEYFVNHPENILGNAVVGKGVKGLDVVKYQADLSNPEEITKQAENLIRTMVNDYKAQAIKEEVEIHTSEADQSQTSVQMNLFGESQTESALMSSYKNIKTVYDQIVQADLNGNENADQLRADLNRVYDSFVGEFGNLNSKAVKKELMQDQPDCLKILALENVTTIEDLETRKTTVSYSKSDIFDHCTIQPSRQESASNDPKDVIYFSFATKGKIDIDLLQEKFGDNWFDQCKEYIYLNPQTEEYELSNLYLSQNIGDKLEEARNAALYDARYERNVKALENAMPKRIGIDDITVNMGSDLADINIYQEFISTDCINVDSWRDRNKIDVRIEYNEAKHEYSVDFHNSATKGFLRGYDVREDCRAQRLFDAAINDQHVKIWDKIDANTKVLNQSLTLIANTRIKEIREKFDEWIHVRAPKETMDKIEDNYNRRFNQYRDTDWRNMQINIVGSTIIPRDHQKAVIARGLTNDDMLMHHAVGAGKTLAFGMTLMERIRLGIAHKCCVLTLKANASQIASEIQGAYPNARILFPNEKDFDKNNRNIFLNKIKHSDADIVILTHDQFDKIKHNDIYRDMFVKEQTESIVELKKIAEEGGKLSPSQRKKIEQTEQNIRNLVDNDNEKLGKDDVSWSELGFDNLAVDESHAFKNLLFSTNHENVKGINADSGSKKAMHLFMAVRQIQDINGGDKGVIFATGTPLSNSLAEMYNLQVFLTPTMLRRQGLTCFDKWADIFAQRQSDWEPDELGKPKLVERFRNFVNLQSLLTSYKGFADIINEKDLLERKLVSNKPKANYQQVIIPFDKNVDGKLFDEFKNIMDEGVSEFLNIDLTEGEKSSAKNLVVITNGAKAAITPKMLGKDTDELDTVHTKVEYLCKNVARIYNETKAQLATQLIFSDLYKSGDKAELDYNLYKDIKKTLVEKYNIPADEIVSIVDIKENKKEEFFKSVNQGKVRIVMGSTQKLGTGVNVQRLACAAHMVDVNWTPSGMIQKTGRVARQGNMFANQFLDNNVPVFLYVKEQSTDAKKYGLVFAKQRMIEQITDKNFKGNRYDEGKSDNDLESDIFQEMLASATGDNTTMVKNKLEKVYGMLQLEKKGHESALNGLNRAIQNNESIRHDILEKKSQVETLIEEIERRGFVKNPKEGTYPFKVTYDGKEYTSAKELGNKMVLDIGVAIDKKRVLNNDLQAFGMTAKLLGNANEGFVVKMTRYPYGELDENLVRYINLSRTIDKNTFANDAESIGRTMNQLLFALRTGKTSIEGRLSEVDVTIKNLKDKRDESSVFAKEDEMNQMRSDIKLLDRTLKGNDLDKEVTNALLNLDNELKTDYSRPKVFLVRDNDKLKLYMNSNIDASSFSEITNIKVDTDTISKHKIAVIANDESLKRSIEFCNNRRIDVAFINNFKEVMDMDSFDITKVDRINDLRVGNIGKVKTMVSEGQEKDKVIQESNAKRLAELRNTKKEKEVEETEEVKQMNSNKITWKELGFPNPEDENADTSRIHDLDNMTVEPIIKTKTKDESSDLNTGMVREPESEYHKIEKNNPMQDIDYNSLEEKKEKNYNIMTDIKKDEIEQPKELSKNELAKRLTELQGKVGAQRMGIDMIQAKAEVRPITLFEEDNLKGSYDDVTKLKKEIEADIKQYTPKVKEDGVYESYVKGITKLNDKLKGMEFELNLALGKDTQEPKKMTVEEAVSKVAELVQENEKKMDEEFKKMAEHNKKIAASSSQVENGNGEQKQDSQAEKKVKADVPMKNPSQTVVGYAQIGAVVNTKGETVNTNLPKIRVQMDLKSIEGKMDKMNVSKKHDGTEVLNFAIIRNKKAGKDQSPFVVIAKRHGEPAMVNGKEVKFSDTAAVLEFSVNMKELKEKAQRVGVDMAEGKIPLSVGQFSGKTGVKINDNSKLVTQKNLPASEYELTNGKSQFVNQFDRIIKTRQNLDESMPQQIRYDNKELGDGISFSKVAFNSQEGTGKQYNDIYFTLNAKAIKELPEADAFGNIKLAVCTKRTDAKFLEANNLHINEKQQLVNPKGERVPDYKIVADPKTYKGGQPYENTKIVLTVNKEELLKYPVLSSGDNKNNRSRDIALKFDGFSNRLELNVSKYIARNQVEEINKFVQQKTGNDKFAHDVKNPYQTNKETVIPVKYEPYSEAVAKQEVAQFNKITDKPSTEEWKNLPSQWDVFAVIVSDLKEKQAKQINDTIKQNSQDEKQDQNVEQSKGRKI